MKRMVIFVLATAVAAPALAQSQRPLRVVTTRSSVDTTRSWQTAGSLVELRSFDPAARTVRLAMGDREQTLVMRDDARFDALAAGGPVFLSWRFNRQARPEATLRVLVDGRSTVAMVGWPADDVRR